MVAANKGMLLQKMKPNRDFQINNWDDLLEDKLQAVFQWWGYWPFLANVKPIVIKDSAFGWNHYGLMQGA